MAAGGPLLRSVQENDFAGCSAGFERLPLEPVLYVLDLIVEAVSASAKAEEGKRLKY